MSFLLRFSESIRSAVREGTVQIQGGIYNLETGCVDFLGRLPTRRGKGEKRLGDFGIWKVKT